MAPPAERDHDGAADPRTFEELMASLEDITRRLATGEMGIEAAADLYEEAERLHALATDRLVQVQQRVERLGRRAGGPGAEVRAPD